MPSPEPARIDLSGQWTLTDATGHYACPIELPGDGITALHAAGLIPDPYWGRNEADLRWIAARDWTIARTVDLTDAGPHELVLSGLDTVAIVRWNGTLVLEARNAFRTHRANLDGVAAEGENRVEITFHSPLAAGRKAREALPFPVPSMHEHPVMGAMCPLPDGNMLRKQQCDFGWDWNIALAPFGLTGDLHLARTDAPAIDALRVTQVWRPDGSVDVNVTVDTSWAENATLTAEFDGEVREFAFGADVRKMSTLFTFTVARPRLWWPAGQGEQALYDLTVTIGGDIRHLRIGLRRIELVTEPDAAGASFLFRVNGRPVFAKGANWIPADALAGRITEGAVRDLLQSAVDANMNMIRVWGGGRYEPDWFYDICDELGLMVWQDFMFACNLYPSTPDFLEEVRAEVAENVGRLQHHACLALWCGDNELVGALGWFPESRENRDRYLVSYDRLNRTIETALREVAPEANWWPSSPSLGPLDFRDGWHVDGQGDMHFWSVWHEGRDFDHYRDVSPRFCSEFGFQSYPSMEVIERFTDPRDRNIASPVLESHQKNPGGNARIAETMFRYFRWPERFDDFVWLSQVQQGLAIHTAVTHWRMLKPHCMGTLYWQLNDTWPVCSWSSLDHGGGWKLLHHMARRFYAPVLAAVVPEGDALALKAVNDTGAPVTVDVAAYAIDMAGTARALAEGSAKVPPDAAVDVARVPRDALMPQEMLAYTWAGADGSGGGDVFAPRPHKAYDLHPPRIDLDAEREDGVWHLSLAAAALGHFVTVEADQPGRFSDNAFPLIPGAPAAITFTPATPGRTPSFRLRDLHSATMAAH